MIQFNQVEKYYEGSGFSLGSVDFQIDDGEFVFLIGPSGSGKTTLIRMLIREELPSSGRIFFDDYDITRLSRNSVYKLRRQLGVVFQDYKLIPDKNAYENVAFAMEVAGKKDSEIKETVPYVLDIVGLTSRSDAFPEQLSGGEKQRVAIARAISNNPRVLIADEPTGNLDPASAWDIVQILSKINNWGTTVIMSTHGTDIVNTLNKRVIQIDKGKVVRDDRKGVYEVTAVAEQTDGDEKKEIELPDEPEKRGPIKVVISQNSKETKEIKARHGIFGFLKLGKKEKIVENEDKADREGKKGEEHNEENSLETQPIVDLSVSEIKEVAKKADRTPIAKLGLDSGVVADLKTAGYDDVEDLISAGPEELASKLTVDPLEVKEVARAISKFVVDTERNLPEGRPERSKKEKPEEELEEKTENEPRKTEEKIKNSNSKRVKIHLAGNK